MAAIEYSLGRIADLDELYPPAHFVNADVGLKGRCEVIAHYTASSLRADRFASPRVAVHRERGQYRVRIQADAEDARLEAFARRHVALLGPDAALKAVAGRALMQELGVWNPMAGYPVNDSASDGESKWALFPPLGLNVIGQRGLLLMHYPPWQVLQQATFNEVMTMHRWKAVLAAAGVPVDEIPRYCTIVDVNPIAAPGSGESEYPNDYFPIMTASAFFSGPPDRDYIGSMLDLYLDPPEVQLGRYTAPLLVCGSPLYDPQAPGWFRVTYKGQMPVDANGTPTTDVLQVGTVRLRPDSERLTPYLVANHMIAAGVTGRCTDDPTAMPDIRLYEAQDLTAATFLHLLSENPDLDPHEAKAQACQRWFGNPAGQGAPQPPAVADRLAICALAQMDLFFVPTPSPRPKYTYEQALQRCRESPSGDPCCGSLAPPT